MSMAIPAEFRNDLRFNFIYKSPGHCPKCNHKTVRAPQAGAMPPRIMCPVCHCSTWEDKGFDFNRDLLPGR
jgi:hypothetical protein